MRAKRGLSFHYTNVLPANIILGRYHNYMQYLATWTDNIGSGNGSVDLNTRPPPTGMLYDNTTVQGSWIDVQNMTDVSNKYGRRVNNVSMAMPHGGVFQAVRDPINNIMQPQDLSVSSYPRHIQEPPLRFTSGLRRILR